MDTTGFSQIGRYGTLSLVKRATSKSVYLGGTNTANSNQIITSFGVDNASLTFGRNLTCDVRLYYPEVEGVHARVVWEDEGEKNRPTATLHVLGESGVYVLGPGGAGKGKVEGKWVYPRYPDEDEDENEHEVEEDQGPPQPTIVELPNNAEFEIAHKRFRVTYPPRGVGARDGVGVPGTPAGGPMLNTPIANKQRRALRLSMIHSAQVFSPRPSADPRENLRVLQSPLKVPATPLRNIFNGAGTGPASPTRARSRSISPLKFSHASADMGANEDEKLEEELEGQPEDQEVILVHTNHPRVVEEDKDLVILEDVPLPLVIGSSSSSPITGTFVAPVQPQPQHAQLAPPVTPKRRSLGGTALHRAVLIRSAQRAVWKAERERMEEEEEKEEEMEVLDSVVDEQVSDEEDEDEDVEMRSVSDEDSDDGEKEDKQQKPLWRKSLEKIIPWRFGSKEIEDEKEEVQEEGHEQNEEHNVDEEEDEKDIVPALQERTPVRRALGSFMTPQHPSSNFETHRKIPGAMGPPPQPPQGRHSLGGGEARRVIAQQPWRVKDLVVPPPPAPSSASSTSSTFAQPPNIFPAYPPAAPQLQPRTPIRSVPVLGVRPGITPRPFPGVATPGLLPQRVAAGSTPLPPPATPRTPAVSAEERRAIQERRRSAVKEAFVLGSGAASAASEGVPGMSPSKSSPSKAMNPMRIGAFEGGAAMPRRSLFPPGSTSPTKGRPLEYAIPEHGAEASFRRVSSEGEEDEVSTDEMLERMRETVESMKRRRSLALGVGSVASTPVRATSVVEASAPGGLRASLSPKKLDFSRLAQGFTTPESETVPEAKTEDPMDMDLDEEAESAVAPPPVPSLLRTPARSTEVPVVRVEVVGPVDEEEAEPAPAITKAKPKARLLRAPAPEAPKEDPVVEVEDHVEEIPVPATRSSVKPPSRSRTAARSRSRSPLPPAPPPVARSSSRTPVAPTEEANDATLAIPAPKTRSARSRSRTPQPPQVQPEKVEYHPTEAAVDEEVEAEAGPVEEEETEEEAKPVKKATRARGGASNKAKPTAAPTTAVAAPSRARSRSRAPVPVPVVDDEPKLDLNPEPPVTKIVKPKATRGRPKKATTAAPSEDEMDDDDDELGTYQMATPAPSAPAQAKASTTKKTTATTKTPAAAAKPPSKIASGSRSTGSKRTRTPVQVKQEEEAEPAPAPVAKRSSSKANINTKTPASTTAEEELQTKPAPAKRGRPRKNDAASTPVPSVPVNEEEEKENTPGPSASDEAEEQQQVVKVRVSRRAGAAAKTTTKASSSATKTKAGSKLKVPKEEDADEQEEGEEVAERKATTGTRTTRIMRMRTRTG